MRKKNRKNRNKRKKNDKRKQKISSKKKKKTHDKQNLKCFLCMLPDNTKNCLHSLLS